MINLTEESLRNRRGSNSLVNNCQCYVHNRCISCHASHAWEKARHVCLCQNSISMELLNHIQTIINMHACCLQSRTTVQPCMQILTLGIVHSHCAPSTTNKIVSECVYSRSNSTHIANINIATGITVNNSCMHIILAIHYQSHDYFDPFYN